MKFFDMFKKPVDFFPHKLQVWVACRPFVGVTFFRCSVLGTKCSVARMLQACPYRKYIQYIYIHTPVG